MKISITTGNIEYNLKSFIKNQAIIDPLLEQLSVNVHNRKNDPCSFIGLAFDKEAINSVLSTVDKIGYVDGIVVVGIGGSNLAARAVETVLFGLFDSQKKVPVWWADTVDQVYIDGIIRSITQLFEQRKRVLLIIVSKSGTTFETMVNAEIFINVFKQYYKSNYFEHIIYGSDQGSVLEKKARESNAIFVSIPNAIGGRFSAFSKPHLLILALSGVDIRFFCQGAVAITPDLLESNLNNPAFLRAAGLYDCYQNNIIIHDLFMPGILWHECGNWMRQLIGESLGKAYDNDGNLVNVGFVPTVSICSTDLHSVGQLYVQGPLNRVTTFFNIDVYSYATSNNSFFGVSYSQLIKTSMNAVIQVYDDLKKPYFSIVIPERNAYYIGQIMQMMMVETVLLAGLLSINPFDQPGVILFKNKLSKNI